MSINLYTCTQADLESLNKVGPDTASKIIALRQEVIGGLREPLQVADLAAVRLSVEEWQGFIDNDLLSITFEDQADPNLDQVFEQMEEPVNPTQKETAKHVPSFEEKVSNSISLLAQSLHSLDNKVDDIGTKLTSKLDTVTESVTTLQKQNSGFKSDMDSLKLHESQMMSDLTNHESMMVEIKKLLQQPTSVSSVLPTLWGSGMPTPTQPTHHPFFNPAVPPPGQPPFHAAPPTTLPATINQILFPQAPPTSSLATTQTQPDVKPKTHQQAVIDAIANVIPPTGIYGGKNTSTAANTSAEPTTTMAIPPITTMPITVTTGSASTPIPTSMATKSAGTPDDMEPETRGRSRNRRRRDKQSAADSDSSLSRSPAPPKMERFSGDPTKLSWTSFMARFVRTAERRGWSERKKMDRLFDCLSEKALEYANRSKAETYEALRRELDLRFDLKDAPVAARQRLHVVRQEDEESLEDFLQRVLTITMDGFDKAEVGTLQQLATESFLRGCKHKDAAMTVMNESVASIQQACKRVKTIIANKKAINGGKVTFQEKVFTVDEETRVSNLEKKYNELVKTLQQASSANKSSSPSRYDLGAQGQNWPRQSSPGFYRDRSPSPRGPYGTGPQYRGQSPTRGSTQNTPQYRGQSPVRQSYGGYPYRGDMRQRSPSRDTPYRPPDRYGYPASTPGYPYYNPPPSNYPQGGYYPAPPWSYRDREVSQRSGGSPQRFDGISAARNTGQRPPYFSTNRPRSPDPNVRSTEFDESVQDLNVSGPGMPATNA